MRAVMLSLLVAVAVPASLGLSGIRILPDGGYSDIVVRIEDSVSQDYCTDYIRHLTETLTEASGILNEALGGLAFFKEVTLVVPSHWREARCRVQLAEPNPGVAYQHSDILVTPDSGTPGSLPYTQHSRGCGERGEYLALPQTFLTNWNHTVSLHTSPAKLLVKEWAKFRYGVFDEHGFADDPIYPNFYKVEDKFLPTGTTNAPVRGVWLHTNGTEGCNPASGSCYFDPEGANDEVTCSLGYLSNLPSVKSWCQAGDLHGPLPPTKHNILCSGRPALDIIRSNQDFASLSATPRLQRSLVPTFHIVRNPTPKYVLLIETSSAMASNWKWVRKAVQNLLRYELPDNTNVAIVTFNSEARVESKLASLASDSARARVADTIPDSSNKLGETDVGCVSCGVRVAVEQVLAGREAGGHILLVSSGNSNALAQGRAGSIKTVIGNFGIRMSSILVAPSGTEQKEYRHLAQQSGGLSAIVEKFSPALLVYSTLVERLREVIAIDSRDAANAARTLHHKFLTSDTEDHMNGTFLVDADLGRNTEFGIYVEDDEEHQIKSVTFQDSELKLFGPYTTMSSFYDSVNLKTINFNVGEEPPFDEPARRGMMWSYTIDWYPSNETRDNVVLVRSKPSMVASKGLLTLTAWTNKDPSDTASNTRPLAVYAKLTQGQSPVLDAQIFLEINVRLLNGSVVTLPKMTLIDNGFGEPDMVSGDGVYSRFLTLYPGAGEYSLHITATNNQGKAAFIGHSSASSPSPSPALCCGSRLPLPASPRSPMGVFRRSLPSPLTLALTSVPTDTSGFRPGKIGDLEITLLREKQQLLASWTAPGGDYSDGQVKTYRFVYSQKIEELLSPSVNALALVGFKREDSPGQRVSHVINFKYYSQDYYVGLFAFDEFGHRGNMSNLVLVNVPPPPASTVGSQTEEPTTYTVGPTDWTLIGAIVGGVAVLLLILVILLYCKCCRSRSRNKFNKNSFAKNLKSSGVKVDIPSPPQSESTDASSYESDLKEQGGVYGKTQGTPLGPGQHSATSFGNNLTPTYWSASQLLGEHELRKRDQEEYRQMLSSTLGAIHEYPDYDPHYGYYQPEPAYGGYYPEFSEGQYGRAVGYRGSTAQSEQGGYPGTSYHPGGQYIEHPLNKSSSKLIINSDVSSSTLGIINPSLQGSQQSLHSDVRDPNARNITQV